MEIKLGTRRENAGFTKVIRKKENVAGIRMQTKLQQ